MTRYEETLDNYRYYLQNLINNHYKESFPSLTVPTVVIMKGRRFDKVVKREIDEATGKVISGSVHSFVEKETGNVYKAASYKAPTLNHVRANIYDYESLKNGVGEYGANYIVR